MEKQTPVEWLALRYHHRQGYLSQDDIAEAKAMEKEQIINAHNYGEYNSQFHDALDDKNGEEYFNKTYK
jgi:hypothetical protein